MFFVKCSPQWAYNTKYLLTYVSHMSVCVVPLAVNSLCSHAESVARVISGNDTQFQCFQQFCLIQQQTVLLNYFLFYKLFRPRQFKTTGILSIYDLSSEHSQCAHFCSVYTDTIITSLLSDLVKSSEFLF